MDVEKLKRLKIKASQHSILVIEDCNLIQKQIFVFLKKFFKNVYQAYDGEEGVSQYKKYHPNVILTDISMPKKNGIEMIKDIKFINNDVKVIILSAHNEEDIIMDIIKLDVVHFLLKPLNIEKLIDILLKILGDDHITKYTECIYDLVLLYQQKTHVQLLNYFNDVMIEQEGEIRSIIDEIIYIKVPHIQILAIDNERNTIIELKSINKFMRCNLIDIDKNTNIISLSAPMYADYIPKSSTNKQYFYNSQFNIGLHYKHKFFILSVLDISAHRVTMYLRNTQSELCVADKINLTISLIFDDEAENKEIFARGKITLVSPYKKGLKVIAHIDIEDKFLSDFKRYLTKIETEIIKELTAKI